ncbi:MAG: alpha,alpha-trehalase TreA [Betaproteobacteria bacterium]
MKYSQKVVLHCPVSYRTGLELVLLVVALLSSPGHAAGAPAAPPPSPDKLYGTLFVAVQSAQVYSDQKTFVDAIAHGEPAAIVRAYEAGKDQPGFSLPAFVARNFTAPTDVAAAQPPAADLREHIDGLWPVLTRTTSGAPPNSSLLTLPRPYVVPGGRFREGYYWDSYFTMLGLQESGHERMVDDMLENFAYEIEAYGHVPNGNRTYYLSRSQPPFFALMVALAAQVEGDAPYRRYLPALRKEYAYWMRGAESTPPGHASGHVVVLADGSVLNRYWDAEDTPRPESWLQDVTTARQAAGRANAEVWRDLRAAAESGWDFSSRWLGDGATLTTIRTTAIIPVDLNSLLFKLEKTIAKGCAVVREFACTTTFSARAERRALAIDRVLWQPDGYYADYDWQLRRVRDDRTAAMLLPLFVELAPTHRARSTLRVAESTLLQVGGLATTAVRSGQQWDAPNGWAPLQWIAVEAALHYGRPDLARTIRERFLGDVETLYAQKHKLVEKYLVDGSGVGGGGGEYPLQDGFGWTNGVTLKLLDLRREDGVVTH